MADSQVPFDYTLSKEQLIDSLSTQRFRTYQSAANHDDEYAFRLYLYNARLSKAFLFPLHILEVSLRNQISKVLTRKFGEDWPTHIDLIKTLNTESLGSLEKGKNRAKTASTNDIVSELTFDFWSNLFRAEYDRPLWQTQMQNLLPNQAYTRKSLQQHVKEINHFRNRIAHHEPILGLDLSKVHTQIIALIGAVNKDTMTWTKHHSTVNQVIRTKPSTGAGNKPLLRERSDPNFIVVSSNENLLTLNTHSNKFIVCINQGVYEGILDSADFGNYFMSFIDEQGDLLLELKEHSYAEVVNLCDANQNFISFQETESFYLATEALKGKRIRFILTLDSNNRACGVIAKSHRRY